MFCCLLLRLAVGVSFGDAVEQIGGHGRRVELMHVAEGSGARPPVIRPGYIGCRAGFARSGEGTLRGPSHIQGWHAPRRAPARGCCTRQGGGRSANALLSVLPTWRTALFS